MNRGSIITLGLAAMAIAGPGRTEPAPQAEPRRIFDSAGMLSGADEDSGALLFTLWEPHIRFRVPAQPRSKLDELEKLVVRASEGSRAVTIRYDGSAGRVNSADGTIDYPLCAIKLDDMVFEPESPCANGPAPERASGETALALAVAYQGMGEVSRAKGWLEQVGPLNDPTSRRLLLRARASISEVAAALEKPASLPADRAYMAAFVDYRALAQLEPDDVEIFFSIGSLLEELGDYAEARKWYAEMLRRWPDEDFRLTVRFGALHRIEGDYDKALAQLDGLVARYGPQDGMKFRYHRGWTLTLLGRFEEAVAELTEGLKNQPDYPYAHFRRGCAYAGLGRLQEALADTERGRSLLAGIPGSHIVPIDYDLRRADAVISQIRSASASAPGKPVAGTCKSYWGLDTARTRSPLFTPSE